MRPVSAARWLQGIAVLALPMASMATTSQSSNPLTVAVRHGDCTGALKLVNPRVGSNDAQTAFIAGRMLDEGICVHPDPSGAALYFASAAQLGNQAAELDYATKLGLGVGAEQSYQHAGAVCRNAGIDADARLKPYSLGYACTLRGVAGKLLREKLPDSAFLSGSSAAIVEFNPAGGQLLIRSVPAVGIGPAATGSHMGRPIVDAPLEIQKAWQQAVKLVPKPDETQLDNQTVALTLDVDTTLEAGRKAIRHGQELALQPLLDGDVLPYRKGN
jgi:hypothetical protein